MIGWLRTDGFHWFRLVLSPIYQDHLFYAFRPFRVRYETNDKEILRLRLSDGFLTSPKSAFLQGMIEALGVVEHTMLLLKNKLQR